MIGLIFGLYLPQMPQYQKYAPQLNELFTDHKGITEKSVELGETPSVRANDGSK